MPHFSQTVPYHQQLAFLPLFFTAMKKGAHLLAIGFGAVQLAQTCGEIMWCNHVVKLYGVRSTCGTSTHQ